MMSFRPRNESDGPSGRLAGSCARLLFVLVVLFGLTTVASAEESATAEPRLSCTGLYAYRADDLGNVEEISASTELPRFSIDRRTGDVAGYLIGNLQTTFEFVKTGDEAEELQLRLSWLDTAGTSHSLAISLFSSDLAQPFIWSDMQVIYTGTCV